MYLALLILGMISQSSSVYLPNVECASYIDYVATDPVHYQYNPMYINLHRCHGKFYAPNPHNRKCVPKPEGVTVLNISAFHTTFGGQPTTLKVENHTACEQRCIITQQNCTKFQDFHQDECDCKCNESKGGPSACQYPLVWDPLRCDCACPRQKQNCSNRKEFSTEECGCTCKAKHILRCAKRKQSIDKETCYCERPLVVGKQQSGCDGGVNGTMLAVIIVVEFFFIVFCYYFFYVYCYKNNYLSRKADKENSGHYCNGDVSTDFQGLKGGTYHGEKYGCDDDFNYNNTSDKDRIRLEETNRVNNLQPEEERRLEPDANNKRGDYYADEEKAPFVKQQDDEYYMYSGDIMQVDGPPSSTDGHNLNIPPDYSDCVSELTSEEGYASVTQV